MKKSLLEIDYEEIFRPETIASLKGKSGDSLRQMLGDKSLHQAMMSSTQLIPDIIEAEKGYRDQLELIATEMVIDVYPIIDYANIRIDAQIVDMGDVKINEPEEGEIPVGEEPTIAEKTKRRIINGITQGASIRGAFAYMLFREYIDAIDDGLVDKYNEILKNSFGIYDSEEAIAMLLSLMSQKQNTAGGSSEMVYDEENEQFVVKARAICFPMLVHEIVKGLYEIVGTEGFGTDREKNKSIINAVDKLSNEPRDLQYGKFIYDAINDIYIDSNINDDRIRELLFTEIYKLDEEDFISFVENAINGELTSDQQRWARNTMIDIQSDLRKDDLPFEV